MAVRGNVYLSLEFFRQDDFLEFPTCTEFSLHSEERNPWFVCNTVSNSSVMFSQDLLDWLLVRLVWYLKLSGSCTSWFHPFLSASMTLRAVCVTTPGTYRTCAYLYRKYLTFFVWCFARYESGSAVHAWGYSILCNVQWDTVRKHVIRSILQQNVVVLTLPFLVPAFSHSNTVVTVVLFWQLLCFHYYNVFLSCA